MVQLEPAEPEGGERYDVVLFRGELESLVFSGDLKRCEDWLALNGDGFRDGYFEIRPGSV